MINTNHNADPQFSFTFLFEQTVHIPECKDQNEVNSDQTIKFEYIDWTPVQIENLHIYLLEQSLEVIKFSKTKKDVLDVFTWMEAYRSSDPFTFHTCCAVAQLNPDDLYDLVVNEYMESSLYRHINVLNTSRSIKAINRSRRWINNDPDADYFTFSHVIERLGLNENKIKSLIDL